MPTVILLQNININIKEAREIEGRVEYTTTIKVYIKC